ncbi:MAG TPA: DUF3159 domain-containing protein [Anaerolineae bacterium]|nr:DUF3159 domain-containing protein [Anaerolineae bacterium]HQI86948.1 DUF3159 domain-containing protein [Anaerolineae bacterium]
MRDKARELLEEFRGVTGKVGLLDTILPPILFLMLNSLAGFTAATSGALGLSVIIVVLRLRRGQSMLYSLGGMGSVALAIALALLLGRAEGYFIPGIVNSGITVALAVVSLIIRKPMVAWTSYLARRWPLEWYWHARVRPAYTEVTLAWILFFALRLFWQVNLFQRQDTGYLALVNALTGWPATIVLLIISYLYGTWRLAMLRGPSVEEFRNNAPAPWQGQRRGF